MSLLRISKSGFDATNTTDPRNLIFSSDYNSLKLHSILTANITVNDADFTQYFPTGGTATSVYLPSDINYLPYFFTSISGSYNGGSTFSAFDYLFLGAGVGDAYNNLNGNRFTPGLDYSPGGTNTISVNFIIYVFANPI